METCARCNVDSEEVRLFDAIYNGRMGMICERCSIIENIPIIKKPDAIQLRESEQGVKVYKRMKRLSGIEENERKKTFFIGDKLNELNKKPELELPEKEKLNLIEHFHWEIMKNRRRKGLSQLQLAEVLGESEIVIQMIEKANLPENAEILIRKLEQFFQIRLRKISEMEKIMREKEKEPVLLNERGNELKVIPEPESETVPELEIKELELDNELEKGYDLEDFEAVDVGGRESFEEIKEPVEKRLRGVKDFEIKKTDLSGVTIGDLKNLHKRKIEATKQEKIEEQKKIEEKQRLIEARKEELRLRREKESKELDNILGGSELLRGSEEEFKRREEFDEELI